MFFKQSFDKHSLHQISIRNDKKCRSNTTFDRKQSLFHIPDVRRLLFTFFFFFPSSEFRSQPNFFAHRLFLLRYFADSRDILSPVNRPRTMCPGFTCSRPLARCIPANKRCNRVVDCLEAEDEDNCSMPSTGDFIKILLGRENLPPTTTTTTTTTTTATTRRPGN